jgi:hypothetical protein
MLVFADAEVVGRLQWPFRLLGGSHRSGSSAACLTLLAQIGETKCRPFEGSYSLGQQSFSLSIGTLPCIASVLRKVSSSIFLDRRIVHGKTENRVAIPDACRGNCPLQQIYVRPIYDSESVPSHTEVVSGDHNGREAFTCQRQIRLPARA